MDFWFQVEVRIGQRNTTTQFWTTKGSRPRALYPTTEETVPLIAPHVDNHIMNRRLEQISAKTELGQHGVVIIDGAGWHQASLVDEISNMCMSKLPPYSPELNPIEQVWSWLR